MTNYITHHQINCARQVQTSWKNYLQYTTAMQTCKPKPEPQKLSRKTVKPSRAGFLLSRSREIFELSRAEEKLCHYFCIRTA